MDPQMVREVGRLLHAAKVLALALVIIAVFFAVLYLLCLLVDGRKLRRKQRDKMPPAAEHQNCLCQVHPVDDDETKTWPDPGAEA